MYTEGGLPIYERLWLVFFPLFFFSREGSTAAQKRREGGVEGKEGERETERASGMRRHGREIERRN